METTAGFLQVTTSLFDLLIKYNHLAAYYLGYELWNQSVINKIREVEKNQWHNFFLISSGLLDDQILNINKSWYFFHYLLTGYNTLDKPDNFNFFHPLISINKEDKLPFINAILGGKCLFYGYYICVRYLTSNEVNQMTNALSKLELFDVIERLDTGEYENYIYDSLSDYPYYDALVDYYKDAADKGNAMLLWLN
ncbi:MAG: DUF1877 family protein [Cyanobacteria bacterium P01_D01_bin.50]